MRDGLVAERAHAQRIGDERPEGRGEGGRIPAWRDHPRGAVIEGLSRSRAVGEIIDDGEYQPNHRRPRHPS